MSGVETVLQEDGLGVLTLNRPEVRNALNPDLLEELAVQAAALDANPSCGALLLLAAGDHFCAGADLKARWPTAYAELVVTGAGDRHGLARVRKPVIAAVQGAVVGAGLELALMADILLAADDAIFALPEFSMGALPVSGAVRRLTVRMGPARTADLVLSGRKVNAAEALAAGLVSAVHPKAELARAAHALGGRLARAPRELGVMAKSLLAEARGEGEPDRFERYLGFAAFAAMSARSG